MRTNSTNSLMRRYEVVSESRLIPSLPVIIRVDGQAFHTLTRDFAKPFDWMLIRAMQMTMMSLCERIPGTKFGYVQSDEISLVLGCDGQQEPWFDYRVEKLCSISASIATISFERAMRRLIEQEFENPDDDARERIDIPCRVRSATTYTDAIERGATFDARAFNISPADIVPYVIWRQTDASRNSLSMLAHALFPDKALVGKKAAQVHDMLHGIGVNWNDLPVTTKRGSACLRRKTEVTGYNPVEDRHVRVLRNRWVLDENMPIVSRCPEYVSEAIAPLRGRMD